MIQGRRRSRLEPAPFSFRRIISGKIYVYAHNGINNSNTDAPETVNGLIEKLILIIRTT